MNVTVIVRVKTSRTSGTMDLQVYRSKQKRGGTAENRFREQY